MRLAREKSKIMPIMTVKSKTPARRLNSGLANRLPQVIFWDDNFKTDNGLLNMSLNDNSAQTN
jgi:hypothetical protein